MLTFLAVAQLGSFTKASEVLLTSKSNVSRKIRVLFQNDYAKFHCIYMPLRAI